MDHLSGIASRVRRQSSEVRVTNRIRQFGQYFLIGLFPMALSACAIPPAVTFLSFVADGVTLAGSDKTVSDHALSFVAGQDCALWRIFDDAEICVESDDEWFQRKDRGEDRGMVQVGDAGFQERGGMRARRLPQAPSAVESVAKGYAVADSDDIRKVRARSTIPVKVLPAVARAGPRYEKPAAPPRTSAKRAVGTS